MADDSGELETRPSLLFRVRDPGDTEAWNSFVDVYGPLVYGHCRKAGLAHEDAEDVTQEVFARVSAAIRAFEYRPEVARFRTWLGTVVRNEIKRLFKKKARRVNGQGGPAAEQALENLAAEAKDTDWTADFNTHLFRTALARTRPHFEQPTWRAFELVWLENRPATQVAGELHKAIDWVYVAKSRVLRRLWQEIQELADDSILQAARSG